MREEADLLAALLPYPRLLLQRGSGSWVWDSNDKRYLDFTSGIGVLALGHGHPELNAVLNAQYGQLGHCSNLFANRPQLELAERLVARSFASKVWFANSGTEANEAALKFARLHGRARGGAKKHVFIAFEQGFHGRTMGALAVTHEPAYREPFVPLVDGVRFARFNDIDSVRAVMDDDVCAVIAEPVQGEGGVLPAAPGFLQQLREVCDAHGALLVLDEIQCGLGRLGTLFAHEHFGVVPDIVTLAKPIAGGLPLGAVLLNAAVAEVIKVGHHGSTFAGGPVVCAVACRLWDLIAEQGFLDGVLAKGARLLAGLREIAAASPMYAMARGAGLMQALVVADAAATPPVQVVSRAREAGLLVTRAGHTAVRILPPLNCSEDEIDHALSVLGRISRG